MMNARRRGGVPFIRRHTITTVVASVVSTIPARETRTMSIANGISGEIRNLFAGQAETQPAIEPAGTSAGDVKIQTTVGTTTVNTATPQMIFSGRPSSQPVGKVRTRVRLTMKMTGSVARPMPNSHGLDEDCRMYGTATNPHTIRSGP
jgi:hypothetical protein